MAATIVPRQPDEAGWIRVEPPGLDTLQAWVFDEELPEAVDGCEGVDPDGTCEHGAPSWLRAMGLI